MIAVADSSTTAPVIARMNVTISILSRYNDHLVRRKLDAAPIENLAGPHTAIETQQPREAEQKEFRPIGAVGVDRGPEPPDNLVTRKFLVSPPDQHGADMGCAPLAASPIAGSGRITGLDDRPTPFREERQESILRPRTIETGAVSNVVAVVADLDP